MLHNFVERVSHLNCIPKRLESVVGTYLFFLTLEIKKHSFRYAGDLLPLHESRFCELLNQPERNKLAKTCLNHASRRRLAKLLGVNHHQLKGRIVIIIDSTLMRRRGKQVENRGVFNHGQGRVLGHKFVNFVILTADGIIPMDSIPIYSRKYCREHGMKYRTEAQIVQQWIQAFPHQGYFTKEDLARVVFLMDSGLDVKAIQNAIIGIGAHFVMAIKSNRSVGGTSVSEYFRNHRCIPWKSIRLKTGNGGKKQRRKYSIRHATEAHLKGVGKVTIVCSEKKRLGRKTRKYLAASDSSMTPRDIVQWYRLRWTIETWHREIKQGFGFGDCRSSRFSAVEAHVNFCLTAYCLHYECEEDLPPPKITAHEYATVVELKEIRRKLSQYGGKENAKIHIQSVLAKVANGRCL